MGGISENLTECVVKRGKSSKRLTEASDVAWVISEITSKTLCKALKVSSNKQFVIVTIQYLLN